MATFHEYLQQRETARADQARALARGRAAKFSAEDFLKMHAAEEWAGLEEQVWSLVQGEEVSGQRFYNADHAVGLGGVAVRFVSQATNPSASPCLFGLVFGKDQDSSDSAAAERWKMRAVVSEGDILWTRADVPARRAATRADLANQIATRLVEWFDREEKASGRDSLFVGGAPRRG